MAGKNSNDSSHTQRETVITKPLALKDLNGAPEIPWRTKDLLAG
jgi:hypothetical protein